MVGLDSAYVSRTLYWRKPASIQMAERLGNWAINQKVAGSIPVSENVCSVLGQGTSPYLPRGNVPVLTVCVFFWTNTTLFLGQASHQVRHGSTAPQNFHMKYGTGLIVGGAAFCVAVWSFVSAVAIVTLCAVCVSFLEVYMKEFLQTSNSVTVSQPPPTCMPAVLCVPYCSTIVTTLLITMHLCACYPIHQWFSTLVLESRCPAQFRHFPAPTHLIQMNGRKQASAELDNDPFIWIRCVGAGKHLKHAGQGALRISAKNQRFDLFLLFQVLTQTGITWNLSPVGKRLPKPWRLAEEAEEAEEE